MDKPNSRTTRGSTTGCRVGSGRRREWPPRAVPATGARPATGGVRGAISTGVYGWPMDDGARVALSTVRGTPTSVAEVRFVLFDAAAYAVFERALGEAPPG